jgi:hypothetical protein
MKNNFFGMNINRAVDAQPLLVKIDSKRFWDDGCSWVHVNPARGEFDPTTITKWITVLQAAGVKDVLFELGGTPSWASTNQAQGCDYNRLGYCSPPSDLHSDGTGPNLIWREWCKYIAQLFTTFPGVLVSGWCPWNEFTRQVGWTGTHSWLGTSQQMVRLAEDARAIILGRGHGITATHETITEALATVGLTSAAYNRTNSSVLLSPSSGAGKWFFPKLLAYYSTPGAVEAVEASAVHLYPEPDNTSKGALAVFDAYVAAMSGYPIKPLWITEGSYRGGPSSGQSIADFVRGYYTELYNLVDRIYWYAYDDPTCGQLASGKLLLPSGVAYNEVYKKLIVPST